MDPLASESAGWASDYMRFSTLESPEAVEKAGLILNEALDSGINFLDTAACYGNSEELVGSAVGHRRDEFVLATKAGHVTGNATGEPWTASVIAESIDRSLRRLKTDHLDLIQLHSCSKEVLERGEVIEALYSARDAGKTRFIGYSGDNEDAVWAIDSGAFDTLQTSLNIVDQFSRTDLLRPAQQRGMGVIIKRPIGNAVWGGVETRLKPPTTYASRASKMADIGPVPKEPDDPILLALGFVFGHPEVDTAIVGTTNMEHLHSNIGMVEQSLPIATEAVEELHRRFDNLGKSWEGTD